MEPLIVSALLYYAGFRNLDDFDSQLDSAFLADPDNRVLLDLETSDTKSALIHVLSFLNPDKIDMDVFGRLLMRTLKAEYQKAGPDLSSFANKTHLLYSYISAGVGFTDPFDILSYADDPLSWGNETQCRELYQKAFDWYEA